MLVAIAKAARSRSFRGRDATGSPNKPKNALTLRGYRKSANLKDGSSNRPSGSNKAGSATGSSSKESFDDFFESLMKGQGQAGRPGGATSTPTSVNLDAILSSLNQPKPTPEETVEADTRFAEMFQRRSAEEAKSKAQDEKAEEIGFDHQAMDQRGVNEAVDELDAEADFQEFLKALKKDYKPGEKAKKKGGLLDLPDVIPKVDLKMPTDFPDVSDLTREGARQRLVESIKEANPELAKYSKWRGPMVTRSEAEADMAETSVKERKMLDETMKEIYGSQELPVWVTSMKVPNQLTGEMVRVDLLKGYANQELGAEAEALLNQDPMGRTMQELVDAGEVERGDEAEHAIDDLTDDPMQGNKKTASEEMSLEHEQEVWNSPEMTELLNSLAENHKSIDDMKYWSLFPKAVKRWVLYTRTPKGFYNDHGEWVTATEKEEELTDEMDEMDELEEGQPETSATAAADAAEEEDEFAEEGDYDPDREANAQDVSDGLAHIEGDWDYWEGLYQNEQQYLPADLRHQFRFHIRPEEIKDLHPRLRRHFSFKFATEGEIIKFRSAEAIRKWGRHPGDSGNSAVQIAVLTLRITHLTKTLRTNPTDSHNTYRLNELIRRRRGLMKHLKKHDLMTYYSLLKDIKLRDQVELWTAARK